MAFYTLTMMSEARGLPEPERRMLAECISAYNNTRKRNETKLRYYEGKVPVKNLGIAVPENVTLDISCGWPAKAVDALANRSRFDGFVFSNGGSSDELDKIVRDTKLVSKYNRLCINELISGCAFVTVSRKQDGRPEIQMHSATSAAAIWDAEKDRVKCGFSIVDGAKDNSDSSWQPSLVNFHTETAIWVLNRVPGTPAWIANEYPHSVGRPLIEALVYKPTAQKPFGQSRITRGVMTIVDNYLRATLRSEIGAEFFTAPQRYLLGADPNELEIPDTWSAIIGNMFVAGGGDNENLQYGQLPAVSMDPHIQYIKSLAGRFAVETGLPQSYLGVLTDNPTSAEALSIECEQLIVEAENLNASNGEALRNVALMALAIDQNVPIDKLSDETADVKAHFLSAATLSLASQADAVIKISSADPGFAGSSVFYEMLGFSQVDIDRIQSEKRRAVGFDMLSEVFSKTATAAQETASGAEINE